VVAEDFEVVCVDVGEDVVDNMWRDAPHGFSQLSGAKVGNTRAGRSLRCVFGGTSFAFAGLFLVKRPERHDFCTVGNHPVFRLDVVAVGAHLFAKRSFCREGPRAEEAHGLEYSQDLLHESGCVDYCVEVYLGCVAGARVGCLAEAARASRTVVLTRRPHEQRLHTQRGWFVVPKGLDIFQLVQTWLPFCVGQAKN
jgi:hypothetical protein